LRRSAFALQPAAAAIPRRGRIVGDSTYPDDERPLALNPPGATRHLYTVGPTGSGKSTLLGNLALSDMADGRAVILVDNRNDLADDVLSRLPESRLSDVVVLDPTDATAVVGLNPLRGRREDAPLLADRLVNIFKQLYAENLGPRSEDILHAGLLTLAQAGGQTLTGLPLLLTHAGFRRQLTAKLHDPLGLGSFWSWYESISDAERRQAIAPLMNKLRAFLLRPAMRRMLGQAEPRFSIHQVFTERRILLVSLARGQLGPETAQLLGALLLNEIWQQALSRAAIPPERRHPVMVYVDEFQEYLRLPTPLADVFTQARGLGLSMNVANQHLDQLTPDVRSAVLGNVGSRVVFRLNEQDAQLFARDSSTLTPEDFRGLGAYEAYASLMVKGERTPYASVRTRPFGPRLREPDSVRRASAERWGRPVAEVDTELERLVARSDPAPSTPIGRRPRSGGAS
jgi:DNA helicase HerA-like ATPase